MEDFPSGHRHRVHCHNPEISTAEINNSILWMANIAWRKHKGPSKKYTWHRLYTRKNGISLACYYPIMRCYVLKFLNKWFIYTYIQTFIQSFIYFISNILTLRHFTKAAPYILVVPTMPTWMGGIVPLGLTSPICVFFQSTIHEDSLWCKCIQLETTWWDVLSVVHRP